MESELSVRDVMTTDYVGVSESDTVQGAVELMRDERTGCVLVVQGSEPVGIMTEWDVLGVVAGELDPGETTVGEVMTAPLLTIGADRSVGDAAETMTRHNVRNLVVEASTGPVNGTDATGSENVLGILTQRDVIAVAGSFGAATARPQPEPVAEAPTAEVAVDHRPNGGEAPTHGVCEVCGSLVNTLQDDQGQLVCAACLDV